jgi:hypothetical protein
MPLMTKNVCRFLTVWTFHIGCCLAAVWPSNLFAVGLDGGNIYLEASSAAGSSVRGFEFAFGGSPAYREEASHLLFEKANQAATELSLPDNLPISARNVAKLMIFPPRLARGIQGLGSVITSNYIYSVLCGYKFSGVTRAHLQQEDDRIKSKFALPMNQMDTNAAFQLAVHFLSSVSMDVTALNRDCKVHIDTSICPDYEHFTPLYYVSWVKRRERFGNVASVEVFLPDKSLRELRVTRSEYILSQPLQITNPDFLSLPTNGFGGQVRNLRPPGP